MKRLETHESLRSAQRAALPDRRRHHPPDQGRLVVPDRSETLQRRERKKVLSAIERFEIAQAMSSKGIEPATAFGEEADVTRRQMESDRREMAWSFKEFERRARYGPPAFEKSVGRSWTSGNGLIAIGVFVVWAMYVAGRTLNLALNEQRFFFVILAVLIVVVGGYLTLFGWDAGFVGVSQSRLRRRPPLRLVGGRGSLSKFYGAMLVLFGSFILFIALTGGR